MTLSTPHNNIENRDIWEYNLDFTPEELDFFVAHLWEVGHAQSKYYFFTRNCSYMLMETLDAVRPSRLDWQKVSGADHSAGYDKGGQPGAGIGKGL
ncbi:MAG: DUF4105 domain-containing protein [Alphaproteobacteria bacterium]